MSKYERVISITDEEAEFKSLHIDVYSILELFNVTSHPVAHAIKKLLRMGSGDKTAELDVYEAIVCLECFIATNRRSATIDNEMKEAGG